MALKDSILNIVLKAKDLASGQLDKFRRNLDKTAESSKRADNAIINLTKRALSLGAAFFGIKGIGDASVGILRTGSAFENLEKQLRALTGSAQKAQAANDWIREFTANTPLQMEAVTNAFVRLKAFGLDPMDGSMQAIVDANERMGGGAERLEGIITALGQSWAKGKVQAEEMNQLLERGIPAWDLLAQSTGKNVAELQKMVTAGELGREAVTGLIQAMGDQAAGAAAANMNSMSGYVSNLRDEWSYFIEAVNDAGVFDYAKDNLAALLARIKELKENGQLDKWAQQISDAMIATSEAFKGFVRFVVQAKDELILFAQVIAGIKLANFIGGIARSTAGLIGLGAAATKGAAGVRLLSLAMKGIPGAILVQFAVNGVQFAIDKLNEYQEKTKEILDQQTQLALSQDAWRNQQQSLQAVAQTMQDYADRYREFKDLEILAQEDVLALNNVELAQYRAKLDAYRAFQRSKLAELAAENELGNVSNRRLEAQRKAYERAVEASEELAEITDRIADRQRNGLSRSTQEIIDKYDTLRGAGMGAADALQEVVEAIPIDAPDGLRAMGVLVRDLAKDADLSAEEMEKALSEAFANVSDGELVRMSKQINTALSGGKEAARLLANEINGRLSESFKAFDLDMQEISTGISEAGQESLGHFDNVILKVKELEASGVEAGQAVVEAFQAMREELNETEAAIAEEKLNQALEEGVITTEEHTEALKEQETQAEKTGETHRRAARVATESQRQVQQAAEETAESLQVAGRGAAALGELVAASLFTARQELEALSTASLRAFDLELGFNVEPALGDIEQLKQSAEQARIEAFEAAQSVLTGMDTTGLRSYTAQIQVAKNNAVAAFSEQKAAYLELVQAMERGDLQGAELIRAAEYGIRAFDQLDQTDLSALEGAIRSARDEMESLTESANNALGSLQDELDRLRGNTDAIEERRYQEKKAELEAALREAEAAGNTEAAKRLRESLGVLQEIRRERQRQAEEEAKIAQQRQAQNEQSSLSEQRASRPESSNNSNAGQQQVQITLPSGKTVNFSGGEDDANAFLEYLEETGQRTIA